MPLKQDIFDQSHSSCPMNNLQKKENKREDQKP
uniref:Uncharacterized protein n=1 Tax=Anguilla anguilla TaxID=7936 RepID=A0A0E9VY82_ANGAN